MKTTFVLTGLCMLALTLITPTVFAETNDAETLSNDSTGPSVGVGVGFCANVPPKTAACVWVGAGIVS
jgi:hypothetical protein